MSGADRIICTRFSAQLVKGVEVAVGTVVDVPVRGGKAVRFLGTGEITRLRGPEYSEIHCFLFGS